MQMKKRMILLVCIALLCGAVLTGCGANEESSAPPKEIAPEVVTSSHMREKVGEEIPWEQLPREALELYSGQDTKYRVALSLLNDADDRSEFYRLWEEGAFGTVYWVPPEHLVVIEGQLPRFYAEVDENGLRKLLAFPFFAVELIDEFPKYSSVVHPDSL